MDDTASLGHARLSVIDLETGSQPISNEDRSVFVSYNGEIYNFREIRESGLESRHSFATKTDTEVIVHLYEEMGMELLNELRGNFAISLWDKNTETMYLVRDRLGIRPLYYTLHGGRLLFGSEIKAILKSPYISKEIDFRALDDYLTYLYIPPPRTIFKNICKILPGQYLKWKNGQADLETYWRLDPLSKGDVPAMDNPSPEACREFLDPLMEETVKLHMVSDIPIGAFLSGGLDSSTVLAYMARHSSSPICTYTIGFEQGSEFYDEREPADIVARHFGAEHSEIVVHPDCAELLPKTVAVFDEPFGNPTSLLAYVLCRETKKRVSVTLSGDGGDEVFGGYPRYFGTLLSGYYRSLPLVFRKAAAGFTRFIPEDTSGSHRLRRIREFLTGNTMAPEEMYISWVAYYTPRMREMLYTDRVKNHLGNHDAERFLRDIFADAGEASLVDAVNYVDIRSFLPYNEFEYDDKMSMAHGLEVRSPFVDHVLLENLARIPMAWKISRFRYKILLKNVMRGILPDEIIDRSKIGFNPPMGIWLKNDLKGLTEDYLSRLSIEKAGFFKYNYIRDLLEMHNSGKRDLSLNIWALLVFMEWHRQYID